MVELFDRFIGALMQVLPLSPFSGALTDLSGIAPEWLGYLNFFFPVKGCLLLMAAWLAAIGVYYLYQIVMRWVGMIA